MIEDKLYKPGEPWEMFPPSVSDRTRFREYERNKALYKGRHAEVFDKARAWIRKKPGVERRLYIACNFCRIISSLIADLLFSEPLRISIPENRQAQERLREMMKNTGLQANLYESALSGSYRGGAVLKTQWNVGEGSSIVSVPSQHYFPHCDPDDQRKLLGATIAWKRKERDGKEYLRREIHTAGLVRQELWLLTGDKPMERVKLSTLGIDLPDELETGCPSLLVEYVPNMRLDDEYWGDSDYTAIERPLEALNERLSHLHRVLDVHSEPVLVIPNELLRERHDAPGKLEYDKTNSGTAIGAPTKDEADIVRYVTWDAHLTAAFSEIEKLLDMLMVCAEISPDMFGMGQGGVAESGRALKMRWARQLAKRQRREMVYDGALRRLLRCASILDGKFGKGPAIADSDSLGLLWGDGLPSDPRETAEEESILLGAGISSKRSSFMRAMQAEEEDAERERAQIMTEKREEMELASYSLVNKSSDDE